MYFLLKMPVLRYCQHKNDNFVYFVVLLSYDTCHKNLWTTQAQDITDCLYNNNISIIIKQMIKEKEWENNFIHQINKGTFGWNLITLEKVSRNRKSNKFLLIKNKSKIIRKKGYSTSFSLCKAFYRFSLN